MKHKKFVTVSDSDCLQYSSAHVEPFTMHDGHYQYPDYFGFDPRKSHIRLRFSAIFNTFGQLGFLRHFNLADKGSISDLFSAGGILAALIVGYMYDKRSRKITINTSDALICISGGALQADSINVAMLLVTRFITGCGIEMIVFLIPIFQKEISPPMAFSLTNMAFVVLSPQPMI